MDSRRLTRLVRWVNTTRPDLIIITGDVLNAPAHMRPVEARRVADVLAALRAPVGKLAVLGNHDCRGDCKAALARKLLRRAGVRLLVNRQITLPRHFGDVVVAGLDDGQNGRPDLRLLRRDPNAALHIALLHEPDLLRLYSRNGSHLALSGHTHGGQIHLPLLGAPYRPHLGRLYDGGLYSVGDTLLHVDSGVGMTGLPLRFGCLPQFSLLTIRYASNKGQKTGRKSGQNAGKNF